jgi:hypothetical protein
VCFVHSDISRRTFIEQISLGVAAAAAVAGVGSRLAAAAEGVPVAGVGKPDLVGGSPAKNSSTTGRSRNNRTAHSIY